MFSKDDLISSYTRAQAIADGVLVDLTDSAQRYGFKLSLVATHAVWHGCIEWTPADSERKPGLGQSTEGRLADVLLMAHRAARQTLGDRGPFSVLRVPRDGVRERAEQVDLVLHIGPGDNGEPVLTLMEPGED